jgi:hypothetical protein
MKVIVKPKCEIPFNEIPTGYVYVCSFQGNTMLKLQNGEAVALTWSNGDDCLNMAAVTKNKPATKILGKLTEIIVEEE